MYKLNKNEINVILFININSHYNISISNTFGVSTSFIFPSLMYRTYSCLAKERCECRIFCISINFSLSNFHVFKLIMKCSMIKNKELSFYHLFMYF